MITVIIVTITLIYLVDRGWKQFRYMDKIASLPPRDNKGRFSKTGITKASVKPTVHKPIKVNELGNTYYI